MITLLIIADDFTGALDTGIQFAAYGAKTQVVTDRYHDFAKTDPGVQVLVLDAETRHMSPDEAYTTVFQIVRSAIGAKIPHIYKKTDSALRGNVGSELTAAMDAAEVTSMAFVPAFPKLGRITAAGIHYIEGIPVADSVFGQDPFEPVTVSAVGEIIALQSKISVTLQPVDDMDFSVDYPGIRLYDADSDSRLGEIAQGLGKARLRLVAGCAGFAAMLLDLLGLRGAPQPLPALRPAILVACGSVNPITQIQLDRGEEAGFHRIRLTLPQKLDPAWLSSESCTQTINGWRELAKSHPCMILDTGDADGSQDTKHYALGSGLSMEQIRVRISSALGIIVKKLLDEGHTATLMITGGDTLLGFMKAIGISELCPICEVATGAVLSQFTYNGKPFHLISKSGGFGDPDLMLRLAQLAGAMMNQKESHR